MDSDSQFRLSYSVTHARRMLWFLLGVEVFLAGVYILTRIIAPGAPLGPIRGFFNVDQETSIPTWFSSIQLFAIAVVVWVQAPKMSELKTFFVVAGCGFLFLSMDEAAALHDSLFRTAQNLKIPWLRGVEYLAWMVPYAAIGAIGLLVGLRPALILWRRFPREAACIALGAAIFVGGGVAMEVVTHILYKIALDARFYFAVAIEEFLEMTGATVMLYGFLLLGIRLHAAASESAGQEKIPHAAGPDLGSGSL